LPLSGDRLLGVSDSRSCYQANAPTGCAAEVDHLDGINGNSIRVLLNWYALDWEGFPADTDNPAVDDVNEVLSSLPAGENVVFTLLHVPDRFRSAENQDLSPPKKDDSTSQTAFRAFLAKAFDLWGDRIGAFEPFNEINTLYYWTGTGLPDAAHYLQYFKIAAEEGGDAGVPVYVGSLLPGISAADGYLPEDYLHQLYKAGLRPRDVDATSGYDGLSFHFYPWEKENNGGVEPIDTGFAAAINDFRYGYEWADPDPPVLISEIGATTTGPSHLSEAQQASLIEDELRYAAGLPNLKGILVYEMYDNASNGGFLAGFGLITEPSATAPARLKVAYCRVQSLAAIPVLDLSCPEGSATTWATNKPACANGLDDDSDGNVDYPADAGCRDPGDDEATAYPTFNGSYPALPAWSPKVGEAYWVNVGRWSGSPTPTVDVQWQRCNSVGTSCVNISGATCLNRANWTTCSVTPALSDLGKKFKAKVKGYQPNTTPVDLELVTKVVVLS
jgi:hypothetical protein